VEQFWLKSVTSFYSLFAVSSAVGLFTWSCAFTF
jgi:hypothetical protein